MAASCTWCCEACIYSTDSTAYAAAQLLQIIFYLLVFLTLDPITRQLWECTNPADAACAAVWQAPSTTAFCSMSASQWKWSNTGTWQSTPQNFAHTGPHVSCKQFGCMVPMICRTPTSDTPAAPVMSSWQHMIL
jgi:hypothetical protein